MSHFCWVFLQLDHVPDPLSDSAPTSLHLKLVSMKLVQENFLRWLVAHVMGWVCLPCPQFSSSYGCFTSWQAQYSTQLHPLHLAHVPPPHFCRAHLPACRIPVRSEKEKILLCLPPLQRNPFLKRKRLHPP